MNKEIIINDTQYETRVALLEDSVIAELFIERNDPSEIAGNIYKGKVQRVLPGMQAAFIEIGLEQAAFIYVSDVFKIDAKEYENLFSNDPDAESGGTTSGHEFESEFNPNHVPFNHPADKIEDLIKEGQEILVQVSKSPIGNKGARVTSHISLPGRYVVLMPTSDHIGVSKKIEDEKERQRLKMIVSELRRGNVGYIVRTAGEYVDSDQLAAEMKYLGKLWDTIQRKFKSCSAPSLLHQEISVILRAVRDLLTNEVEKIVIDSKTGFNALLDFLNEYMPHLKDSIEWYQQNDPIFDAYHLEPDLAKGLKRKVWLKSGGYIIIEQTEALVAIDINTGRYVGKHDLEETILKTNMEAVKEIARQIRLRDLGGIIIIDFIDMEKKENQEKIYNELKEALKRDRTKTHVLPMSEMGLIQMTRKRIRKPPSQILCEPCFYCEGEGTLLSGKSVCLNIYRDTLKMAQDNVGVKISIRVHPKIAECLHGTEHYIVTSLESELKKEITIYSDNRYHFEKFEIFEVLKN